MDKHAEDLLRRGTAELAVSFESETLGRLIAFAELLLKWNAKLNLTAHRTVEAVLERHVLDSLALRPHLDPTARLLDVGSGPGVPGLVLRIAGHQGPVVSVEAVAKKVAFQKQVVATLGVSGLSVVQKNLQPGDAAQWPPFDAAVSRAFTNPEGWLAFGRAFVRPGGCVLGMISAEQQRGWSPAGVIMNAYRLPGSEIQRFIWTYSVPPDVPRET